MQRSLHRYVRKAAGRARRRATVLLLAMAAAATASAQAPRPVSRTQEAELWARPETNTVRPDQVAFTSRRFRFTKSESVYAMAVFSDGFTDNWVLMFSIFRYDTLVFDKWAIYALVVEPDGTCHWYTHDLPNKDVEFSETAMFVGDAANRFYGENDRYHLTVDLAGGFACDLTYENILPSWMLGDGIDRLTPDGAVYQQRAVLSPWAWVSGTITFGGRTMNVHGQGMTEKTLIVNPLTRFNPELFSMRVFSSPFSDERTGWHVGLLDSTAHKAYGEKRLPRLFVAKEGEWLLATDDYTIDFLHITKNTDPPYQFPDTFRLRSSVRGYTLDGVYRTSVLFNITDVVSEVPAWLRALVLLFLKRPVYFRCIGVFTGTLTFPDGTIEELDLFGPYEYVIAQ